jgi:DNA (cytosine-5)-methyltransferase 1
MQGIPDGWVTDVRHLSRNAMLRILGNGVVSQQAAAAMPWLLATLDTSLGEVA